MMLSLLCLVLALLLVSLALTDGWLMFGLYSLLSVSTAMLVFIMAFR